MGTFRIRCVVIDQDEASPGHAGVREVRVGSRRYSVRQVAKWIDEGTHSFYTTSKEGEHRRGVLTCRCRERPGLHIRSAPGDRTDNDLLAQPACPRV